MATQDNQDTIVQVLNDLLKINNDRIQGYEKAAEEVFEFDLKTIFRGMADESRKNASVLTREVIKLGGAADVNETTASGKIYRIWMDVKSSLTGNERHSTLSLCEYGEDAAQAAYKEALRHKELTSPLKELIFDQQISLKASHDTIKRYRDTEAQPHHYN